MPRPLRPELQQMLMYHRSRIPPERHNLTSPSGRGRRVPGGGLSQAQMDWLLESRWTGKYGQFERGQLSNPDEGYLRRVAEILELTEEEWTALWALARHAKPPRPLHPRADQRIDPTWQVVLDRHPDMAYITDRAWNLLAYNEAFAQMFESGVPPQNTMEYMVLTEEARRTLVDWERSWAPHVLSQLRSAHAEQPDNPTLRDLVAKVVEDPQAGPIYTTDPRALIHPDGNTRPFHHPRLGPGRVQLNAAGPYGTPGSRLIFVHFMPEAVVVRHDGRHESPLASGPPGQ